MQDPIAMLQRTLDGASALVGSVEPGELAQPTPCEAWDVRDLYVVDGAVLPTGLGVNPMVTIEAAAHKIARGMAAKLS